MAFVAGYNIGARFKVAGAAGFTSLSITGHSWSEQIDKIDVTHTDTGGVQALLAGILRGDGNVKANFDTAQIPPNTAPGIKAGVKGIMEFKVGTSNPFKVPCLITRVNYKNAVEGKVEYDFDVSLDYLVGVSESQSYQYPT